MKPCKYCGQKIRMRMPSGRLNSLAIFCNRSCSAKWRSEQPGFLEKLHTPESNLKKSKAKSKHHREHPEIAEAARLRMLTDNPMVNPATRLKQSATLKAIGHKPKVRGGNGSGPTKAEIVLLKLLPGSLCNYPVRTGKKSGSGYPTCYKVDVSIPVLKLGIEADGNSHNNPNRRARDQKKDALLKELGWTVLRFQNRTILEKPDFVEELVASTISKLKNIHPIA